jgi:hypothetical protein
MTPSGIDPATYRLGSKRNIYEMFIRGIYKSGAKKCGTQTNISLNKVQVLIKNIMTRNEGGGLFVIGLFLGLHVYAYVHTCTYFYLRTHRYVRI